MQQNKENELKTKKVKKKNNKQKNIIILVSICIALFIITTVICCCVLLNKSKYEEYVKYEDKMKIYGFDVMYDNNTSTTSEYVTKSEAIKLILSVMLNTNDITKMSVKIEETYENEQYVNYAVLSEIISSDEITKDNFNDIVRYEELLQYVEASKKILLKEDPKTDVIIEAKNYERINQDLQIPYADLVANEIIPNKKSNIKLKGKVVKGMLNEILINIAEKFNTITVGDSKLNINPEKVPDNADQYTYILSNVSKEVYEYEFIKSIFEDEFLNPKEAYLKKKDVYDSIPYIVEGYYDLILNIDYSTINYDEFYEKLKSYLVMAPDEDKIKQYVEYVKENQIKLSGSAKVQMPIVYFDGEKYRARTKVSFEILNSNTKTNILVFDTYDNYTFDYTENKYEVIVDTPMTTAYKVNSLYVRPEEIITSIVNENKSINQIIDESIPTTIVELEELNKEIEKLKSQQ